MDHILDIIKNPEIFEENRLRAHSDHLVYANKDEYIAGKISNRLSLNGLWKFHYCENLALRPRDFEKIDYDCSYWTEIHVPAHVQIEGYGQPQYVNVQYPWDGIEDVPLGAAPNRYNPVASYVRYVDLPENWKGQPVFLCLEGAEAAAAVWCNGLYIGYAEDSFTPSEFELTASLNTGKNKIAVQVFRWTTASWLEDQDFFRFSGLFREVYLYTRPPVHIFDIDIKPELNEELDVGILHCKFELEAEIPLDDCEIALSLRRYNVMFENSVFLRQDPETLPELLHKTIAIGGNTAQLQCSIEKPLLWSAEKPELYLAVIELKQKNKTLEYCVQPIGFRKFCIKNGLLTLNNRRIVFHGVNRHEFCHESGRVVSKEQTLQDVLTMKRHNINAVRTSHYPNSTCLYELCDVFGLYLIDETNMETHGTWAHLPIGDFTKVDRRGILPDDKKEFRNALFDRVNNMYQRDKNHPSILFWSMGNESFGGKTIYEMSELIRKKDKSRLIHFESISQDGSYPDTTDVYSQMYTPAIKVEQFLQKNTEKPMILCEFTHSMGTSNGAMDKYIRLTETNPRYQGGFIWDYIDQAIIKKDPFGGGYEAYGGDFYDRPHDGNFSGDGIVFANRSPTPKMQAIKYCYQYIIATCDNGKIFIHNKYLFTNTNEFNLELLLYKEGVLIKKMQIETSVPPLSKAEYDCPFVIDDTENEYSIIVSFQLKKDSNWARRGHEVAFGQQIIGGKKKFKLVCSKPQIILGKFNLGVRGDYFSLLFASQQGGLVSYKTAGKELLRSVPMPNFWRPPTDNDIANCMPQRYAHWKLASLYCSVKTFAAGQTAVNFERKVFDDHVEAIFQYHLPTVPLAVCTVVYSAYANGWVRVKLSYPVIKELADMPEFGMIFYLPKEYDEFEWYGYGPEATYSDLLQGAKLGIYKNRVQDNMAAYLRPQESGAKLGIRWAKITNNRGQGLQIFGDNLGLSVLPYTPHEIENAKHHFELPRPYQTVVRVFSEQMGIAGDDTWGARTHEEYLVDVSMKIKEFSFYIEGI